MVSIDTELLKSLGFTNHIPGKWYFSERIIPGESLSFNLTIYESGEYDHIILDEDFGQPYHYGLYNTVIKQPIIEYIDNKIAYFRDATGLDIEFDHEEYGYTPEAN